MSTDDDEDHSDEKFIDNAKKGGKEILNGLSKGGMLFSKRFAEGMFNAQIAQTDKEETREKLRAVGGEMSKAILKGAIEGATESLPNIVSGVTIIATALAKEKKKMESQNQDNDNDYEIDD